MTTEIPQNLDQKIERPDTALVRSKLEQQGILKKYPNIVLWSIGENIVASGLNGNTEVYDRVNLATKETETLFNLSSIRKDPIFTKGAYLAWFRETGDRQLYRISDIDKKTGDPIEKAKAIDPKGLEYFHAWERIVFMTDRLTLEAWEQPNSDNVRHPVSETTFRAMIRSGAARLLDALLLVKYKRIDGGILLRVSAELRDNLAKQISDERFDAAHNPVTQKELDTCKEMGFIEDGLYIQLSKLLRNKNKLRGTKDSGRGTVGKDTKKALKEIR